MATDSQVLRATMDRDDIENRSVDISHFRLTLQLARISALAPFKICQERVTGSGGVRLRGSWSGTALAAGAAIAAVGAVAVMLVLHPRYFPSLPAPGAISDAIVAYAQPLQALVTVVTFAMRARGNMESALGNALALDAMLGLNTPTEVSKVRRFLFIETAVIMIFMISLWILTILSFGEVNALPMFLCNAYLVGVNISAIVQLTNTALFVRSRAQHLNKIFINLCGVGTKRNLEDIVLQYTHSVQVTTEGTIHCKRSCDEVNTHLNGENRKLSEPRQIIMRQNKQNSYTFKEEDEIVITTAGLSSNNYTLTPTSNQLSNNSLVWNTKDMAAPSVTQLDVYRNQQMDTDFSAATTKIYSSNTHTFRIKSNNSLQNKYNGNNLPLTQRGLENSSSFTSPIIMPCPCERVCQGVCDARVLASARLARAAHCLLGNICDATNSFHGLPALLETLKTLACLVYWLTHIFQNMFSNTYGGVSANVGVSLEMDGRTWVTMACFFLWVVFHTLKMALMTWACGSAAAEIAQTVTVAQKLQVLLSPPLIPRSPAVQQQEGQQVMAGKIREGSAALTQLACHVTQRQARFVATGGIPLDQSLLLSLATAVATYLLVLMQICDNTTPPRA